ncbi:MAG: hypothetical protein M1826_000232 [Phylliscum demangeonii]|nr:MAG: hypothetical protein M1826_000232 [Phylliscum demangeonii]
MSPRQRTTGDQRSRSDDDEAAIALSSVDAQAARETPTPPPSQSLPPLPIPTSSSIESRPSRRKPPPSPLQSVQTSSPGLRRDDNTTLPAPSAGSFPRPPTTRPFSPRAVVDPTPPASNQVDERPPVPVGLRSESPPNVARPTPAPAEAEPSTSTSTPTAPPRANGGGVAAPITTAVSPAGPVVIGRPSKMAVAPRPQTADSWSSDVRKSSIDSAISTIFSQASSSSRKSSQDSLEPNMDDIASLATAAGSPEAAIQYLLKEKQHSAAQNAQLWNLVDKQRNMIIGLNKDLERALQDKERYRKKLKEHLPRATPPSDKRPDHPPPSTTDAPRPAGAPPSEALAPDHVPTPPAIDGAATAPAKGTAPALHRFTPPASRESSTSPKQTTTSAMPHALATTRLPSSPPASEARTMSPATSSPTSLRSTDLSTWGVDATGHRAVILPDQTTAQTSLALHEPSPAQTSLALSEPSPGPGKSPTTAHGSRKAPPVPLDLGRLKPAALRLPQLASEDPAEFEHDDRLEDDAIPKLDRGRRKTREEDDRVREVTARQEQEYRSRSKKEKSTSTAHDEATDAVPEPAIAPKKATAIYPPTARSHAANALPVSLLPDPAPSPLPLALRQLRAENTALRSPHPILRPPMSPGLPMSPRPGDRPMNSPRPRLPREASGLATPMTSMFAPRPAAPASIQPARPPLMGPYGSQRSVASVDSRRSTADRSSASPHGRSARSVQSKHDGESVEGFRGLVYRGFMSEEYPDLLLSPAALPSIWLEVADIRPDAPRSVPTEHDSIVTLRVGAKAEGTELWRLRKSQRSLTQLDQALKAGSDASADLPHLTDFVGHASDRHEARRSGCDRYFEAMAQASLGAPAALAFCRFLSTDVTAPRGTDSAPSTATSAGNTSFLLGLDPKVRKDGYLTKRGKNFGGWKRRFFTLDGPVLRYYENPGGPHLGTIRLRNAQVGKESRRGHEPETDPDPRHGFHVLEPKKRDAASHVRHVLCAESGRERDEWVAALLQYVDESESEEERAGKSKASEAGGKDGERVRRPTPSRNSPAASQDGDSLRGLSYEETMPGDAPMRGGEPALASPSPAAVRQRSQISGPTNGAVIHDVVAWGNKPPPLHVADKKEHKKRGIWGFKSRTSSESSIPTPTSLAPSTGSLPTSHPGRARAVFGAPLAEATEHVQPAGVEVYLPAVVYRCIEYLDAKEATDEEGIFRLSGSSVVIRSLRDRFNAEGDVNLLTDDHYYDVHAVASLLKLYLRELPASVLTRELHLEFLRVGELDSREAKIERLRTLVHQLPRANHSLLRALSSFLITIVENSDVNKMTVRNVGIVFSPTLNIPAPVLSMFLTDFPVIFGLDPEEHHSSSSAAVVDEMASPLPLPLPLPLPPHLAPAPTDIRSPRRQMFQDLPTPAFHQVSFPKTPRLASASFAPALHHPPEPPTSRFGPQGPASHGHGAGPGPAVVASQNTSGHEYGSLNSAMAPADVKAQRRESSIFLPAGSEPAYLLRGYGGSPRASSALDIPEDGIPL